MKKTSPIKHIHKYMRTQLKYVSIWRCATCYHFMPQHMTDLVAGRDSVCWGCGNVFKLDEYNMRDEFPTCISCSRSGNIITDDSLIQLKG